MSFKDATILPILKVAFSSKSKSARDKWARFMRTHQVNFSPQGRFMVCSEHFVEDYFERSVHDISLILS